MTFNYKLLVRKVGLGSAIILSFLLMSVLIFGKVSLTKKKLLKPHVLVTTSIIKDLVQVVGQDDIVLDSLMGAGVDPHIYVPTARDTQKIYGADLVFYNGLHLESKLADLLESLDGAVAISRTLNTKDLIFVSKYTVDPHIWFDLDLWQQATQTVADALAILIPEKKEVFDQRAKDYIDALIRKEKAVEEALASVPKHKQVLITAHDAFAYLAKAYGWEVLALQGISTASEASAYHIRHVVNYIIENQIPAIFVEQSVDTRQILAIQKAVAAKGFQVKIGGHLYTDALGPEGSEAQSYLDMISHNIKTIVYSLNPNEKSLRVTGL